MLLGYRPEIATGLTSNVHTVDEAYSALGVAVCCVAANDYRNAYSNHLHGILNAKYEVESLERFFRSGLFTILSQSNVDPEYIIKEIRQEQEDLFYGRRKW